MSDQYNYDYGWEKKITYTGCKFSGDTFDIIIKVPIVKSKSLWTRMKNNLSATLIWAAVKLSGYDVFYSFDFTYKEKEQSKCQK